MSTTLTPDRSAPVEAPRRLPRRTDVDLQGWTNETLNRHPAVAFSIGLVREGGSTDFAARGFANIEDRRTVDEDTVFRIASITKTFTAIAVMQLHEQGLIDLDAPANEYLRAYRLIPASASHRPATVRHLLTHTAAIPEVVKPMDLFRPDWGDSVGLDEPLPTLAAVYGEGIRLHGEPGETYIYTNHGFATLQQMVEDVTGRPLDVILRERIFEPLGMADTDLLRASRLTPRLARGYAPGPAGPRSVTERAWVTPAASSVYSTTADMTSYIAALIGGGSNQHGRILRPETLATMFAAHFRGDARVPGMGLGFDRIDADGHLVIGHGGILPGFNSQLFVAPDDGIGLIAWATGANLAMLWLPTETGRLMRRLIGVPMDAIRTDVPQRPEVWGEICGRYRLSGGLTDIRARLMTGFGASVRVDGDKPMLRLLSPIPALWRGFELHADDPADPYAFRIDMGRFGLPTARIVFSHEPGTGVTAMHLDIFPMSLRRQPMPAPRRKTILRAAAASAALSVTAAFLARRLMPGPSRPTR